MVVDIIMDLHGSMVVDIVIGFSKPMLVVVELRVCTTQWLLV